MLTIPIAGQIAKSALVGTVMNKLVDSLFTSKINNKLEQQRWIRATKLELFSQLCTNILSQKEEKFPEKIQSIEYTLSKIVLLIDDNTLIKKINDYLFILNEYENAKEYINITILNNELLSILSKNIRKT